MMMTFKVMTLKATQKIAPIRARTIAPTAKAAITTAITTPTKQEDIKEGDSCQSSVCFQVGEDEGRGEEGKEEEEK